MRKIAKIPPRIAGLLISGISLILFGISIFIIFPMKRTVTDSVAVADFSALPARVRMQAPTLALADIHGVQHSLADYRGQVVLVNLWATWCPPCKAELPNLQTFYVRHQAEGFAVVAIEDGDPVADVNSFVQNNGLTFSVLLDPTYQTADRVFQTRNLPSSYLIDRNGWIRLEWFGAISQQNLEQYVTPIIKE